MVIDFTVKNLKKVRLVFIPREIANVILMDRSNFGLGEGTVIESKFRSKTVIL